MKLKNNYVNLYKFTIKSITYVMEDNYISGEGEEVDWYSEVKKEDMEIVYSYLKKGGE